MQIIRKIWKKTRLIVQKPRWKREIDLEAQKEDSYEYNSCSWEINDDLIPATFMVINILSFYQHKAWNWGSM